MTPCHNCGQAGLEMANSFGEIVRVTSDCKPWKSGGQLGRCCQCGLVQSPVTDQWLSEISSIYREYEIYHQASGQEQGVFSPGGERQSRSQLLMQKLLSSQTFGETGRLLDIGCGNGSFLRVCSQSLPGWNLAGTETGVKHKSDVEAIPRVERLYTSDISDIPGQFDFISLIHVLEHIPGPATFLARTAQLLRPAGQLLVQVPDALENPFSLLIADHCSHFSPASLMAVVSRACFEIELIRTDWVPKEITLLARKRQNSSAVGEEKVSHESMQVFQNHLWLKQVLREAEEAARAGMFGIFGTSIAGTWLGSQLSEHVSFFVDEDPSRTSLFGKPIVHPKDAQPGSVVFLAFPARIGRPIAERLEALRADVTWLVPS